MKTFILMTLIFSSSVFAKNKTQGLKLSDLGKINFEKTLVEVEQNKITKQLEQEQKEAEDLEYKAEKAHQYQSNRNGQKIHNHTPFTKYNSETKNWQTN